MLQALLTILFISSAPAEVYMGLNPSSENKCDLDLINGVENQISRALCMESLDPSCLQDYYNKKLAMPTPKYIANGVGEKTSTSAEAINILSNSQYHISNKKQIVEKWLESTTTSRAKEASCRPSTYFPSPKEIVSWQVNPADLIEGTLGWVPILGDIISTVKNLMNSMSYVDLGKTDPETTCNWSAIHVSTIKEGADCIPYYNAESPAVRHFLRQSDTDKKKLIADPNTCAYYNKLLAALYTRNEVIERRLIANLPELTNPVCMGKNKVSFDLTVAQAGWDREYKIETNTSKNNPSMIITGIMDPNPNVDLTIRYEDRGKGHLCEKPKSNGLGVDKEMKKLIAGSSLASAITSACCETKDSTTCIAKNVRTRGAKRDSPASNTVDPSKKMKSVEK